jgi:fibronectin-binding autotransporter adhesin
MLAARRFTSRSKYNCSASSQTHKKLRRRPRWAAISGAVLAVTPFMTRFVSVASATNGTAEYFDVNGTTAGFGVTVPGTNYDQAGDYWSTSSAGTATTGTFAQGDQLTIGSVATDFAGQTFTIALDSASNQDLNGIAINGTSANVTLNGSANVHLDASQTWTVAGSSVLTEDDTRQSPGGLNWNNEAVTFEGTGTINFLTPMGCNSASTTITETMGSGNTQGTVNLDWTTTTGASTFGGTYDLTAGLLNIESSLAMGSGTTGAFADMTAGHTFTITGGAIDNTTGSAGTLDVGSAGGYSFGGNFTFIGSNSLSLGTNAVALTATSTVTVNANVLTIGGNISGAFGFGGAGAGTLALAGTNTFTGALSVNGGDTQLLTGLTNNVASASGITVAAGATLDLTGVTGGNGFALNGSQSITNNGTVLGNITAAAGQSISGQGGTYATVNLSGGTLMPGNVTTPGTLSMSNLNVNSGAWAIKILGGTSDFISVSSGSTNLSSLNLSIAQISAPTLGTYDVLSSPGGLSGLTAGTVLTYGRTNYTIDSTALGNNSLQLDVSGGPASLVWTSLDPTNPALWDNLQTAANWNATVGGGSDTTHFYEGDNVTFDSVNNAGGQYTVTLAATGVSPGSITMANGANTNYVFAGSGAITTGSLLMNSSDGTGTLTIDTTNTYALGTTVESGDLIANSKSALGSGPIVINGGTLNLNTAGAVGTNSISLSSGVLNLGITGAIGAGPLTFSGGTIGNTSTTAITLPSNTQSWAGNFAFAGPQNLNMGTGAVALSNNPVVNVAAGTLTVGGTISGTGQSLTKTGIGELVLTGTNNPFSGGLTINAGTVLASGSGGNSALGSGNTIVNAGATLIGAGADNFGYYSSSNDNAPYTIFINGGTVTDLGTSDYRITSPNYTFTGGTLTSAAGNTELGSGDGNYSLFGTAGLCTITTNGTSATALISAQAISFQSPTVFNVGLGTTPSGVDLLVTSALLANGTQPVTKTGPGLLALDNDTTGSTSNTYGGAITISAGTVQVGLASDTNNVVSPFGTSAATVADNSTLSFASAKTVTVPNAISGSGTLIVSSGTLSLSSTSTYSGPTTISNAAFVLNGMLATGNTVTVNSGSLTETGIINRAVSLTNSALTASGSIGALTLNNSTMTVGNLTTLGTLTASGIDMTGGLWTIKLAGTASDFINVSSGVASFSSGSDITVSELSGATATSYEVLSAPGGITGLTGDEVLATVGRTTFFVDPTELAADILQLDVGGSPASLFWTGAGSNPSVWDALQTSANWTSTAPSDPNHFYNGDNVTFDNAHNTSGVYTINLSNGNVAPGSITATNGAATNYVINGPGSITSGSLLMNSNDGTGTLTINTSNTYTNGTTISNGTLVAANNQALGLNTVPTAIVSLNPSAGNTATLAFTSPSPVIGSLASSGAGMSNVVLGNTALGAATTLTIGGNGISSVFSGTISDGTATNAAAVGNLVTTGTLTLLGSNTYTGSTTVNAGSSLQIGGGSAAGSLAGSSSIIDNGMLTFDRSDSPVIGNAISGVGNVQQLGTGTLILTGSLSFAGTTTMTNGSLQISGANVDTLAGTISGAGNVTVGDGITATSLTLLGANTYTGTTTINPLSTVQVGNGTLGTSQLGSANASNAGPVVVNGTLLINISNTTGGSNAGDWTNSFSGSGLITMAGTTDGVEFLGSFTGFTGNISVGNGDRFQIGVAASSPFSASNITIASGGAMFGAPSGTFTGNISFGGVGWSNDSGGKNYGALRFSSTSTLAGTVTLTSSVSEINQDGGATDITGPIVDGNGGAAVLALTSNGGGTGGMLILSNSNNNWGGGTDIECGTIVLGANGALGVGPLALGTPASGAYAGTTVGSGLVANVAGTLNLAGFNATVTGLAAEGTLGGVIESTTGSPTLTFAGANGSASTFSGLIENGIALAVNSGTLILTGANTGTVNLTGTNTYTGGTTVNGGELVVGNLSAIGSSPTPVVSGGTLNFGGNAFTLTQLTVNSGSADVNGAGIAVGTLTGTGGAFTNSSATPGTLTLNGNTNSSWGGSFQDGASALNVNYNSSGTMTLSGNSTSTAGTFNLNSGAVVVTGSLASGGNVMVAGNSSLSGTGSVGNVTLNGGTITPGTTPGSIAAFTMNSLTADGGVLQASISSAGIDEFVVNGAANFAGGTNIDLNPQVGTLPGIYTLLAAQTLTGAGNVNFQAPTGARQQYALNFSGNDILVDVTGQSPANLVWIGNQNNGQWDLQQTSNWYDPTYDIAHDAFYSFDNVTFNDTASDFNVNLSGNLTAGSVTVNTNGTYTFSGGSIVGGTSLTKSGTGLLVLQNQNQYTGTTALQNGTIQLQNGNGLGTGPVSFGDTSGDSGVLDLDGQNASVGGLSVVGGSANVIGSSSGGSTLNFNGGAGISTFSGSIDDVLPGSSGNGQLQLNVNSGTLVLTGSNNFSGNITIGNNGTAGFLQIGSGTTGNIGTGNININVGSLVFDVNTNPTISGQINGQGTLAQIGSGSTLLLTQGGNWGATVIGAGSTLQVGNGNNANMSSGPVADNGTLVLDTNQNFSINGVISGSGSLQQIGSGGIVTLAGANTYTGTTTIGSGAIVAVATETSLGSLTGGAVTIEAGGQLDLSALPSPALPAPGFGTKLYNIAGFGPNGDGAIVNNGTVANTAEHGFDNVTLTANAGIGGTNYEWPNTPNSGYGRIDIGRDGTASVLNLNGYTLLKLGTNFLDLGATNLTVTAGNIVANNGTFSFDENGSFLSTAMGYVVMDGVPNNSPNLQFFNTGTGKVTVPIVFNGNGISFGQADGADTSTVGSNVFLGGSATFSSYNGSNGGGLNFTGNLTDLTTAMAGTLNAIPNMQNGIVGGTSNGTVGFVAGVGSITLSSFSGTLSSTLILSGTSSYSGGTQINQYMTLKAGSNSGFSSVGPMTLNNGTLDVGGFSPTVGPLNGNGTITNSGSVTGTLNVDQVGNSSYGGIITDGATAKTALGLEGSGTLQLQNANTYSGGTFLNGAVLQINNLSSLGAGGVTFNGGTLQLQSNLDPSAQGITFNSGGGSIDMNGQGNITLAHVMTGVGALTIEDSSNNNNTLTLSGSNTYSGGTTVASGAVQAGAVNVFGTGPLTVGSATLANLNGYNQLVGGLAGTGVIDNIPNGNTGNPVLTINNATGHAVTFNGSLQNSNGVVSLVMQGGTQVFASANSYSGGTTITGGLLIAANSSGSATGNGNVTVSSGGGLGGGAGTVSGNVSVAGGGILSLVGGSPLTLSGSLALANGADLNFSAAATTAAGLASTLSNGISITGSSAVNVTVPTSFTGTETFDVLSYLGSDPFADLALGTVQAGYNGHLVNNTSGDQVDLSLTAIPIGPANLTWDNAGGTGNGTTWDTSNQNWNNGTGAALYTDGSNVTFNDANNGHYAVTLNSSVLPLSVTFANNTGNYSLSGTGGIAGTTALTLSGTGTVTISTTNSYSGGTNVNSGKLVVASAGALPANHALSIGTAGAVALATTGGGLVVGGTGSAGGFSLSSLSMSTGSSLDLGSNAVTIHYGGTDPVSQIASYLSTGFASGGIHGWGGTAGIVSSTVASLNLSQSALIYSVGYADGADGINPAIPSGEIEIMPTLAGDAKMQGNVVFGDFQLLSQYFGDAGTSWDEGDFTYNGTTNFGDFQLLSQNFGASSASLTSGELAAINSFAAQFGDTMESNGTLVSNAAVPEPATMGMLAVAGLGLLSRRRRRAAK